MWRLLYLYSSKNSATIISLQDLKHKKVAIQKDDIAKNLIEPWMQVVITETENQTDALELLVDGQVDAYIGNRLAGLYSIQKQGYQNAVKMTGGLINAEKYGFVINKDDKELVEAFNEGLVIIKKMEPMIEYMPSGLVMRSSHQLPILKTYY